MRVAKRSSIFDDIHGGDKAEKCKPLFCENGTFTHYRFLQLLAYIFKSARGWPCRELHHLIYRRERRVIIV